MNLFNGCHRRTVLKYILLQLPGTVLLILSLFILDYWVNLQTPWFWGLILLWILKEIVLFPLTWKSYQSPGPEADETLIGMTGRVITAIDPEGVIEVRGELWAASCHGSLRPMQPGELVKVIARSGLKLEVAFDADPEGSQLN